MNSWYECLSFSARLTSSSKSSAIFFRRRLFKSCSMSSFIARLLLLFHRQDEIVGRDVAKHHWLEPVDVVEPVVRGLLHGGQQRPLGVVTPHLRQPPKRKGPAQTALLLQRLRVLGQWGLGLGELLLFRRAL